MSQYRPSTGLLAVYIRLEHVRASERHTAIVIRHIIWLPDTLIPYSIGCCIIAWRHFISQIYLNKL